VQQNHSKTLFEPFRIHFRNYEKEKPVDDHVFEVLKTFYSYDKGELNYKLESTEVQSYLKKEKVSFDAAYGRERMFAYLFFPLNRKPPYQTVIYFPGSGAEFFSSSQNIGEIEYSDYLDFLVRGGRAVVYPIYKGTFERGGGPQGKNRTADEMREWRIQCVKDVSRTLDYLEERNEIDKNRIAYYGYSWGAGMGGVVGAVENRFKTMILLHGGLPLRERQVEIDPINFVPRIRIPVLMINGKYDSNYPVESSQKPMFRLLETPETNKVHLLFETGHTSPRSDVVKIVLDWLDRYLGPA
ncbi:MAG TPA: prolyl oligopeptidase family serine peptidase, partial [Acidobacteriota bacterium]|nr:prolyl oligopeptidase family serine peptidase [Acidobacteriota bacterium]